MKTTQRLKEQIFQQVQTSGLLKQLQSKLKTQVLSLVEKESNQNKKLLGFQYEHPLLSKLKKYPLTSLCIDLIQQFLESFKFKYTLSVFKKEINRQFTVGRIDLAKNFNIQIKNAENQAVLLSLVGQLVSGDIKAGPSKQNNLFATVNKIQQIQSQPRVNNFIGNESIKQQIPVTTVTLKNSSPIAQNNANIPQNNQSQNKASLNATVSQPLKINEDKNPTVSSNPKPSDSPSVIEPQNKITDTSASLNQEQNQSKQVKGDKSKKIKKKKQIEKPPEEATDLLGELMSKFQTKSAKSDELIKTKMLQEKRAYSEQKEKKVVDPNESGTNKIRGASMGKMPSFMNKFMPASMQPAKIESYIEEQLDEFQQSKDSTKKNPLFSSSQSGFDKSGYYDKSVESNAIDDFEYVEKAKKFNKKS